MVFHKGNIFRTQFKTGWLADVSRHLSSHPFEPATARQTYTATFSHRHDTYFCGFCWCWLHINYCATAAEKKNQNPSCHNIPNNHNNAHTYSMLRVSAAMKSGKKRTKLAPQKTTTTYDWVIADDIYARKRFSSQNTKKKKTCAAVSAKYGKSLQASNQDHHDFVVSQGMRRLYAILMRMMSASFLLHIITYIRAVYLLSAGM